VTVPVVVTASPAPIVSVEATAAPQVSFVIVTFGTGAIIGDCLGALVCSMDLEGFTAEVIVVDNLHPVLGHRTADRLAVMSAGVRLLRPPSNLGFGGGCELGAAHARAEVLCFMNPDVLVPPRWISPLLDRLDRRPRTVVAPTLSNADGTIQEAGVHLDARGFTAPSTQLDDSRRVDYASAACWLVRREFHQEVGGFDARFHPAYYEDVDYALRTRRLGGDVVVDPDTRVVHLSGASTDAAPTSTDRQRTEFVDAWRGWLWRQQPLGQTAPN
jgi:O-antigen biosynthesis protein